MFIASVRQLLLFSYCCLLSVTATRLCQKDNYWYDDYNGKCRPCEPCKMKFLEIKPCSEFSNTMCVDPSAFTFLQKPAPKKTVESSTADVSAGQHTTHKWHEMETMDSESLRKRLYNAKAQAVRTTNNPEAGDRYSLWDVAIVVVLCVTLTAVLMAVVTMVLKHGGRIFTRNDGRKGMKNRLFSRDRLSTTEYMNTLATLDRRLAMDEILEKKRRAIFEPQLLAENIYTDEVFVDMAGSGSRRYEELRHDDQEPTRSLLKAQQLQN